MDVVNNGGLRAPSPRLQQQQHQQSNLAGLVDGGMTQQNLAALQQSLANNSALLNKRQDKQAEKI